MSFIRFDLYSPRFTILTSREKESQTVERKPDRMVGFDSHRKQEHPKDEEKCKGFHFAKREAILMQYPADSPPHRGDHQRLSSLNCRSSMRPCASNVRAQEKVGLLITSMNVSVWMNTRSAQMKWAGVSFGVFSSRAGARSA